VALSLRLASNNSFKRTKYRCAALCRLTPTLGRKNAANTHNFDKAEYKDMSFHFNQNACVTIIKFYTDRLKSIRSEISFMEGELDAAEDHIVRFAFEEAITRRKYDEAFAEMKIREMEHYLQASSSTDQPAA
jgi:hypothetical protein